VRCKDESKFHAIYKATLSLVKERGLAGITMGDISKEASIATGTLYIYFKNKDELIRGLFTECRQKSARHYFEGLESSLSFEDRMKKLFHNIIYFKMRHFEISAFLEQTSHSPYVHITDLKKKQKAMQPLFDLINEGIEKNKLKDIDIELVVSYLSGIVNELVKRAYFANRKLTDAVISEVYEMFWDGIKYTG
jgi:TetR/AcrR family transcriptional regulator, repressor of fatR-cypB operon